MAGSTLAGLSTLIVEDEALLPRQPAAHLETLDSEKSDLSLSYEFTWRVYDTELARDAWRFRTARWLLSAEARLVYRAATP